MSEVAEESFISHLVELRDRLLRSLIAIAVMMGFSASIPARARFTTFWRHR